MWDDRFSFSGETPTDYPGLNPVALQRIDPGTAAKTYKDAITPSRLWTRHSDGTLDGNTAGPWGTLVYVNQVNPATEKGYMRLPNFAGLWPAAGRILIGMWVRQSYAMTFCPLISTRSGSQPLVYLSTNKSGQIRPQVYDTAGNLVADYYENAHGALPSVYQYQGMMLDRDAGTVQAFAVRADTRETWIGVEKALTGPARAASNAPLDVFSLGDGTNYSGGIMDEILVAHPTQDFDLATWVDDLALGQYSNSQDPSRAAHFTVTDTGITATTADTFTTGAEHVSWVKQPAVQGAPAGARAYWSTDDGTTWNNGTTVPYPLTGLMYWTIPLAKNATFTGITITEPVDPPPTLATIPNQTLTQGQLTNITITHTIVGPPTWTINAPNLITATINNTTLALAAGFEVGSTTVTVTLTDQIGREVSRSFTVTVNAAAWVEGTPPRYPHAPILINDDDGNPQAVVIDATNAVVTKEVNGAHTFEFELPATHRHASLVQAERTVEVADERYWVRRIETARSRNDVTINVYAEARFYELATAGQIDAREFKQVTAGDVMTIALAGTGWKIGVANVSTLRTYQIEDSNPLALLRTVQENHGGDLVFDNTARTVSLVTTSGRDQGVGFFYGHGLTEARRVEDTTSLVTRLYARNADGVTIAAVNGGKPYVEDFTFTDEVKTAVYDFKSGTSPYTMLSMAQATLANRSRPDYSYEVTVSDLSARTAVDTDRFDVGDVVTVVDSAVGISETQRIVRLEYNVIRPWESGITLYGKLRELGSSETTDAGALETGATVTSFDLVPFNLIKNARFDNELAHWASLGATVVDNEGTGTGDRAVRLSGVGEHWIEQTVTPDNRSAYALSLDIQSQGPAGWNPTVRTTALVTYDDGTTETITINLT
ncbi:MAG: phage tail spike protein [Galactobacter sp.]